MYIDLYSNPSLLYRFKALETEKIKEIEQHIFSSIQTFSKKEN
jgi:hypothetical protein